jgi:SAM-dependent methyltransferase
MIRETVSEERVVEGAAPAKTFAEHIARYRFATAWTQGKSVLDMACGSGYGSRSLLDAGADSVVGVDLDSDAIDYARERYATEGLTFEAGDACAPPDLGRFDAIVSFETIEHLTEPERFLDACVDMLDRDGVLIVSSPHRHRVDDQGKPANPFHVYEWTTAEFEALLKTRFAKVEMYGQLMKLSKGRLPRSLAAAVGALQGQRIKDPGSIYRLPGPGLFGLWKYHPAYLIAVCKKPINRA